MQAQTHLFALPADIHYLNCAYMSPQPLCVEEAGQQALLRKRNPSIMSMEDFFTEAQMAKVLFGKLVNAPAKQVVIMPAASYALKAAFNNIPANQGNHVLIVAEEFGSDYYTAERWCKDHSKELKVIEAPEKRLGRGREWNQHLLEAITPQTAAVVISSVHWADGTLFDLEAIGARCKACDAYFIVDGTQSVGALPIDVERFHIDMLAVAAYKWLMGPYSIGCAYFNERFNTGMPLEETWMNRTNAAVVTNRIYYEDYKSDAARFNMGEQSNFVLMPMLIALQQPRALGVPAIQDYCRTLIQPLIHTLQQEGCWVEEDAWRSSHLFGFSLPQGEDLLAFMGKLKEKRIFTSLRGTAVRVSPHLYNTHENIAALAEAVRTR